MEITEEIDDFHEETDNSKCDKLVENILSLNKTQSLKKPSRTEATIEISEFNLVKSTTENGNIVQLNELTKSLKNRRKSVKIRDKLKSVTGKSVTLPKPLEKPQADRIKRTVAYEQTRLELDRWEAIVTSNRVSTNLNFPLENDLKVDKKNAANFANNWRLKSDFEMELEKFEPKTDDKNKTEIEKFPLTLKEMMSRRKEQAKLRAFEGYKSAKARRQNKIKSKRYHRIQKREKIKKTLKEFEELQKTNPEEALKKLEEIDKVRAEERFNLRHKSTGSWAKNKQIRAKYDKESRKELAEQLTLSRELTQKISAKNDSDQELDVEMDENVEMAEDEDNIWINGIKPDKEVQNFVGNYRKFWTNKNKEENEENKTATREGEKRKNMISKKKKKKIEIKHNEKLITRKADKMEIKKKSKMEQKMSTTEWEISGIDEIFNNLENKITKKVENIKKGLEPNEKKNPKQHKTESKINLNLPLKANRPIIDEQLLENPYKESNNSEQHSINDTLKTIINANISNNSNVTIDPVMFQKAASNKKIIQLENAKPDLMVTNEEMEEEEEEEEEEDQIDLINEALADDDIQADFNEEKQKEIDENKPKAIDVTLPGWGSWAGKDIQPTKRRNKRFVMKVPGKVKRKDDNRKLLIINEKAQKQIREFQVNELPFPFKTIKDYEASIRQPISNTFVPERAFRRFIKPNVTTKMGAIIQPINKDVLLKKSK